MKTMKAEVFAMRVANSGWKESETENRLYETMGLIKIAGVVFENYNKARIEGSSFGWGTTGEILRYTALICDKLKIHFDESFFRVEGKTPSSLNLIQSIFFLAELIHDEASVKIRHGFLESVEFHLRMICFCSTCDLSLEEIENLMDEKVRWWEQ